MHILLALFAPDSNRQAKSCASRGRLKAIISAGFGHLYALVVEVVVKSNNNSPQYTQTIKWFKKGSELIFICLD